jgi:CheY-like chemotaxis protein
VGDGKQAIDRVLSERPDIVLADVGMPERDGYEVAAFIKGQPQLAHIPVLLLTGAFEPIDEARARSVGCDGVLVKPFEPQMVISRVRDLLSGRRARPNPTSDTPETPSAPLAAVPPETPRSQEASPTDGSGGSLEDYFDRLDAALATLGPGNTAPAKPPSLEPIAPPQAAAPASAPPAVPTPGPQPAAPPPVAQAPAPGSDPLGGWDPDLSGAPVKPAAAPSPAAAPAQVAEPVPFAPRAESATAPREPAAPLRAAEPTPGPAAPPASPAVPGGPSLGDAFAALLAAEEGHPIPPGLFAAPPPSAPALNDEAIDEIVRRVIARMGDDSMRRAVLDAAERLVREEIDRIKRGQSG